MNASEIQRQLYIYYSNSDYKLLNTYVFDFESDFFCISKSGYTIEVEIKVSRSDFYADFKKNDRFSKNKKTKHEILQDKTITFKPNKFYFAFPAGMVKEDEVPKYAGIIIVDGYHLNIIRQDPFLHKELLMNNIKFVKKLCDKFYYRCMDLRKALEIRDTDLRYGQKRLDERKY